ncbi:MAG: hypothetical protein L0Z07_07230 [Planctomycetes bacterium]|nr:hypothetical protein [Planctomycetota bacterium]
MTTPGVRLTLDRPVAHYLPGDQLTGQFKIEGSKAWGVRSAELSVLWYTAGKGEEDMAVHHFERLVDDPSKPLDLRVPRPFAAKLPLGPLSYDGDIVKVCWCVRARLFLPHGQTAVAETAFRLGTVPAARPPGQEPDGDSLEAETEQAANS